MTTYAYQLNDLDRFLQIRPGLLAAAFRHVVLIMRIRRERNQLAALSDNQLQDLGFSRFDAYNEAARGLLDIPEHRKAGLYL